MKIIKMNKLSEIDTNTLKSDHLLDFVVIGAGIAGLTAASKLNDLGFVVSVFEKARGTGGRMSSKRVAKHNDEFTAFDLGCVSLTAQNDDFSDQLKSWHLSGVTAPWWTDNQGRDHYVAVPRNSALTRHLSKNLECHFSTRVIAVDQIGGIWHIYREDQSENESRGARKLLARAKNVIIATPPAQARDLLPLNSPFKDLLDKVEVSPQWVMAVEVNKALSGLQAIQYPQSDIVFSISHENNKPGRDVSNSANDNKSIILQVQATASWTNKHLSLSPEDVSNTLIEELEGHFGHALNTVTRYAHRWLYSCVTQGLQTKEGFLMGKNGLGLIGDYINSDRQNDEDGGMKNKSEGVESAWLSGKKLAEWIALNGQQ